MTDPALSVVVPVKEDPGAVDCVASILRAAGTVGTVEVVVVDNGSEPQFGDWLRCELAGKALVVSEPEVGVYRARNRGVEASSGDVVFFTDADCLVSKAWLRAGLTALERGADIVQGFTAGRGSHPIARAIQRSHSIPLQRAREGAPVECATANMVVRRSVFTAARFNEAYRRGGDTELGLVAERLGYRVAYSPQMRVGHAHEPSVALHAARQYCHGWEAQRLMREHPELKWHSLTLRIASRVSWGFEHLPGHALLGRALGRGAVRLGRAADRAPAGNVPWQLWFPVVVMPERIAVLGGHLSYERGKAEPVLSEVLGRALLRD